VRRSREAVLVPSRRGWGRSDVGRWNGAAWSSGSPEGRRGSPYVRPCSGASSGGGGRGGAAGLAALTPKPWRLASAGSTSPVGSGPPREAVGGGGGAWWGRALVGGIGGGGPDRCVFGCVSHELLVMFVCSNSVCASRLSGLLEVAEPCPLVFWAHRAQRAVFLDPTLE